MRPFEESLPMALLGAREAAMQLFRPLLSKHDLTEQQWRVLRALTSTDEPLEVSQLAECTSLLAPSLTRIVANLESRNLITRTVAPHDQRRAIISLSPAGATLVAAIGPASEAQYARIEASFGAERLNALLNELRALRDALDH